MKRYIEYFIFSAFALLCLMPQFGPRASAAPQQQAAAQDKNAGLPWAYGYRTSANAAPAAGAGRGAGRGGAAPAAPTTAAAPAAPAEDENEIRHVPGSTHAFTIKQIDSNDPADWFPEDHPAMPQVVAHGGEGIRACGFCHYPNGKGRPNNAGPAGLPANYILQQLEDFAVGARHSWDKRKTNTQQMIDIAKRLTPEDAKAAADYFASVKLTPWVKVVEADMVPKTMYLGPGGGGSLAKDLEGAQAGMEPLGMRILEAPVDFEQTEPLRNPRSGFIAYVPRGSLKRGEALVVGGGNGKTLACAACHGEGLKGTDTFPSLAGRSPSYLARQLLEFQRFTRVGPGSQLMQPIVQKLNEEDILNIVAYVASLQP